MLSNIFLVLKALMMLFDLFKLLKGEITQAQFNSAVEKIQTDAKKASEGSLEDRLKAGKDVEDNSNKHT